MPPSLIGAQLGGQALEQRDDAQLLEGMRGLNAMARFELRQQVEPSRAR